LRSLYRSTIAENLARFRAEEVVEEFFQIFFIDDFVARPNLFEQQRAQLQRKLANLTIRKA